MDWGPDLDFLKMIFNANDRFLARQKTASPGLDHEKRALIYSIEAMVALLHLNLVIPFLCTLETPSHPILV